MGECVLKILRYKLVGGSGGMLPRENFRNFEMPWTPFHAFSWWRKRERQCRDNVIENNEARPKFTGSYKKKACRRKSQSSALDFSKI